MLKDTISSKSTLLVSLAVLATCIAVNMGANLEFVIITAKIDIIYMLKSVKRINIIKQSVPKSENLSQNTPKK
jgi:hypothetical protein